MCSVAAILHCQSQLTAVIRAEAENPKIWAQICVQNMAKLAHEATAVRRVLDPMLRYFDIGKHWSPGQGLALSVLRDLQILMERTGRVVD